MRINGNTSSVICIFIEAFVNFISISCLNRKCFNQTLVHCRRPYNIFSLVLCLPCPTIQVMLVKSYNKQQNLMSRMQNARRWTDVFTCQVSRFDADKSINLKTRSKMPTSEQKYCYLLKKTKKEGVFIPRKRSLITDKPT